MKLHHAAAVALLMLASCEPTIQKSTERAEAAAARAELSAKQAQQAADQAFNDSVRALRTADQAENDVRRANDVVSRVTPRHGGPQGELLVKPTQGSSVFWCLMYPPVVNADRQFVEFHAPRSRFWVHEIFDSKRECHDALRKFYREFGRLVGRGLPFRVFCAACANEGEED
jgi:hypothetical protein